MFEAPCSIPSVKLMAYDRYFLFLLINVVFIFLLATTYLQLALDLAHSPAKFPEKLAQALLAGRARYLKCVLYSFLKFEYFHAGIFSYPTSSSKVNDFQPQVSRIFNTFDRPRYHAFATSQPWCHHSSSFLSSIPHANSKRYVGVDVDSGGLTYLNYQILLN